MEQPGILAQALVFVFGSVWAGNNYAMADNDARRGSYLFDCRRQTGLPDIICLTLDNYPTGNNAGNGNAAGNSCPQRIGRFDQERFGIRVSIFIFTALLFANLGTIIVDLSAVKTMSSMFNLPEMWVVVFVIAITFIFVTKGNYRLTQNTMLVASLFI